jgi:hypothetical protein
MTVRLYMPENSEVSHVVGPDGAAHQVVIDSDGRRFVEVERDHAKTMLAPGPWPHHNMEIRAANAELAASLGPPPPVQPGVNVARHWAAQRDAAAPRSLTEVTAQTLAAYRRAF